AYSEIAKARFTIEGTGSYPDATFTLRLSYGTVRGYEQDGKQVPAFTDFAGLYQRSAEHDNKPPFDLPQRWIDKKSNLNLSTKFTGRRLCRTARARAELGPTHGTRYSRLSRSGEWIHVL